MSLSRLYRLTEAGVQNEPTGRLRKKWKSFAHPASDEPDEPAYDVDPEPEPDELGGDFDGDFDEPEPEPEKDTPFASKPAAPSKALQSGQSAGTMRADKLTLSTLERALESVRTGDDDLQDWIDNLLSEIGRAIRKGGGEVTLPKFEATPSDLEDDEAGSEDED